MTNINSENCIPTYSLRSLSAASPYGDATTHPSASVTLPLGAHSTPNHSPFPIGSGLPACLGSVRCGELRPFRLMFSDCDLDAQLDTADLVPNPHHFLGLHLSARGGASPLTHIGRHQILLPLHPHKRLQTHPHVPARHMSCRRYHSLWASSAASPSSP